VSQQQLPVLSRTCDGSNSILSQSFVSFKSDLVSV